MQDVCVLQSTQFLPLDSTSNPATVQKNMAAVHFTAIPCEPSTENQETHEKPYVRIFSLN